MGAPIIPITGIDGSWRVPGPYAEVIFAQGPASAATGVREVVFVMPKLSAGTWTATTTLYPVGNEQDVITGAGEGSPLHRGIRKFMQVNKDAKVYALPVAETSGGSPVAATWTCLYATNATARGTTTVYICGEACSFTYASGDTVTTIAAGVKAAINAKPWLPVTADNSSGTLTVTAKLLGVSQGTATVPVISARAEISTGTGTTISVSGAHLGTGVAGADGTTTEAANLASALATIDSTRKYYIVSSANDATSLGHLKTHIVNKSEPRRGLRSVAITAYPGTLANATTLATGRNYERLQILWLEKPDNDCAEIAGAIAGIRQKAEALDATANLATYSLSDILSNCYSNADWPTDTDLNDAINDGLSPIQSTDSGPVWVMNVNTRSKNAAGTQDDFRATECHRVSGADLQVDEVLADWHLNMAGKKLENDTFLENGKPNPNQPLRPNVTRPSLYKPRLFSLLRDFFNRGHSQELDATLESVRVEKNGSRLECGYNLHIIDHNLIGTFRVAEVSTG
jgi:phage tail sheath gpL-like